MSLTSAQIGDEIYLQNKYFSVGVNSYGGLGTVIAAPKGFNADTGRVGLFADLDGFGVGKTTTLHDAILPGRAIEGFNVGYKIGGATVVQSNQYLTGYSQIEGDVANTSTATQAEADWSGSTKDKLAISQKLTLSDDAKFIRIDVTLTNNSGGTLSDVRYMRTADPDQGSTFSTQNKIVAQGSGEALVASYANGVNPFYLYSDDDRARVSTYGFVNTDPYAPQAYNTPQSVGYSKTADQTVNITFAVGNLSAGQSTTLTLYLGVTDNLDATIAAIHAAAAPTTTTPLPNLAPIVQADEASVLAGATVAGNVLANDRDPEGGKLTATLKTGPAHGTLDLNADGSYNYTADKGFAGVDSFTYAASDGKLSSTARASITVSAPPVVNLAPVAVADAAAAVAGQAISGNVLTNDSDPEGATLVAALKSGPVHGTLTLNANGSYSYTADKGYVGTDSFTYTASDGKLTGTATATITVSAPIPNLAPVVANDVASVFASKTISGNVLKNDVDPEGATLTAALATGPAHGTVTVNADGSYSYKADSAFIGKDSFTYTASDGNSNATGNVSITVVALPTVAPAPPPPPPPNLAPVATNDVASVFSSKTITGNVLTNDSDPEAVALTATLATGPAHGTATVNADGSYSYTADSNFVGKDIFTYAASDGNSSATAEVSITVVPLPLPPGDPVLTRAGTIDGSSADAQVLTGAAFHNSFFFDIDVSSGRDRIVNFGSDDVLVTSRALYDGNGDGIIALSKGKLSLDTPKSQDVVTLSGVSSLRFLGEDKDGNFIYSQGSVRPKGAQEGTVTNDALAGDSANRVKDKFFFDTALDIHLGNDLVDNFGTSDLLVTTSALTTGAVGSKIALTNGLVQLAGGSGGPGDIFAPGEVGSVELHGTSGALVSQIEFDGTVDHGGLTYFVYSLSGSSVGIADLTF